MTQVTDTLGPPVDETRDGAGSSVSSRDERGNAGARARAGGFAGLGPNEAVGCRLRAELGQNREKK
jgi:hypothetical protein